MGLHPVIKPEAATNAARALAYQLTSQALRNAIWSSPRRWNYSARIVAGFNETQAFVGREIANGAFIRQTLRPAFPRYACAFRSDYAKCVISPNPLVRQSPKCFVPAFQMRMKCATALDSFGKKAAIDSMAAVEIHGLQVLPVAEHIGEHHSFC
jgi:hypothetical protein